MARSLAAALRSFVSSIARDRGRIVFRSGRISILQSHAAGVSAVVRHSGTHQVTLEIAGSRLIADCSCRAFVQSRNTCRHIWAVILFSDARRLLAPPKEISLHHVSDDAELDDVEIGGIDDPDADEDWPDLFGSAGLRGARRRLTPAFRRAVSERMKRYWAARRRGPAQRRLPPPPPPWHVFLSQVAPPQEAELQPAAFVAGEIAYIVDLERSAAASGLIVDVMTRQRNRSGGWSAPRALGIGRRGIQDLPDAVDRAMLTALCGADQVLEGGWSGCGLDSPVPGSWALNLMLQRELVPRLCETGRLLLRVSAAAGTDVQFLPVDWDPAPAAFHVRIAGDESAGYTVTGVVQAAGRDWPLTDAVFMSSALILWGPQPPEGRPRFAAFDPGGGERWLGRLLEMGPVTVPAPAAAALLEGVAQAGLARVECPDALRIDTVTEPPCPIARITRPAASARGRPASPGDRLDVRVAFAYGDRETEAWSAQPVVFDPERRRAWRRDREAERAALGSLQTLGVRTLADWNASGRTRYDLASTALPRVVRALVSEGWRVEAEGQLYRRPGAMTLDVRSGIDWFELHGRIDFEGVSAGLPVLLAALTRGETVVALSDGTFGQIPDDFLARGGRIAAMGRVSGDHVRFGRSQAALLDAWLATQPAVSCDAVFDQARAALARFDGVAALDPPASFRGVLRDYQRDALGWFDFLRRFGFGGCLADEMGLGKTVMVLAALEARRLDAGRSARPSLVVVPRSLVFNWRQEAARFAPGLRLLDFTGGGRRDVLDRIPEHDVVLTTYGTLRRDIGELKDVAFDYAILDEAQAIKNARTDAAKAVRLLQAAHRLALSGTPVENHLGELWSLFDFLNPGLLGTASVFAGAGRRTADEEDVALLARGLRPFILRRTKEQVATELPSRTEQTIYCDLDPPQRALYDELRSHYRATLLQKVARDGLGQAKLQVLEALLRLRQAACHPGLIDRGRADAPAAKIDVLLPRLQELVEDGRKALVFSQFTSLLGLLRARLDEAGIPYAYLDGRTRDRAARVRSFQENGCPLFLISLKAGGLGLNLTAAEYVFLLDPWWNPAVEAQAIDRAHRIGQTRPVFAFRLIARDTVEEKVLDLQATKRRLADAIVRGDEGLIRDLRREDLELLLS